MVVQPSRVESLGLVCLEARVNAKPVIVADIAIMRELIGPGGDSLVIPFCESTALAVAIQQLLNDRDEREAMGLRGQEKRFSRFPWDTIAKRTHPISQKKETEERRRSQNGRSRRSSPR